MITWFAMDPSELRPLAVETNKEAWTLLGRPGLGDEERARMVEAAYASLDLWRRCGTPLHVARGHWLVCRVLCVVGAPALKSAPVRSANGFTGRRLRGPNANCSTPASTSADSRKSVS